MADELLSVLTRIYGSAGVPAAIADDKLDIIWRNSLAESNRSPLKRENISGFFENNIPVSGMVYLPDNETIHRFNVLKADTPDGCLFIVEHIGSDEIKALLAAPDIKAYMTYLCARIRESVGMIAVSADEIDSASAVFGAGCGEITEQLNTINKGLMLILREVIGPEQLYYTLDPCCNDVTICIADEIEQAASDAKRSLGRSSKVSCRAENSIYTRMNRSVFETIISDMAAECCSGELFPDELIFSCEKTAPDRAAVSVRSLNRSGKKNVPSKFERDKKGSKLYFDYLCSVMCEKYGAVFTKRQVPDGYDCRMEISAISSDVQIVMNGSKFAFHPERFCSMTLSLTEHHLENRYRFVNIDDLSGADEQSGS